MKVRQIFGPKMFLRYISDNKGLIFSIGIILSLVSGLGYYANAIAGYKFSISDITYEDFRISEDEINEYDLMSTLTPSYIQENLNQETAEKLKIYNYFSIYNKKSFLSRNSGTDWIGNTLDLIYLDEGAFSDSHFNQTFVLINGSYPKKANEHLISYQLAQNLYPIAGIFR